MEQWAIGILLLHLLSCIVAQLDNGPEGKCSVVPSSANCRFDCTAAVFDMVCVGQNNWKSVRDDINTLASTGPRLDIYLWNLKSEDICVEASLFGDAQRKIHMLNMMSTDLIMFPQLRGLTTLQELLIVGASNLADFPLESLPDSLEKLEIYHTGITRLENDFDELPYLANLHQFKLGGSTLTYIQPRMFTVFAELASLTLKNNNIALTEDVQDNMFTTKTFVERFEFTGNNFSAMSKETNALFLIKTMESLNVHQSSTVDLSNNNLPIVFDTLDAIKKLKDVRALYLQGNPFENSLTITGLFEDFANIRELDLSYTSLPISVGTFRGLPNLDVLRVAGNYFADMTAVDMFLDSRSTMLRILDLSYNALTGLPEGDLENIADMLEELELTGNSLLPVEFPANTALLNDSYSRPTFAGFPNLRYLGLGSNNFTQLDGNLLAPLRNLRAVDLSCNFFWYINRPFFDNMPKTLVHINLTFCFPDDADAPLIEDDAFASMPPVRTLMLGSGNLRNWIFDRLRAMNAESAAALQIVILNDNDIGFIAAETLTGFGNWTTLSLRGNDLQSLGNASFRYLTGLKSLVIASNQLVNLDSNDLQGLVNIEHLDFQYNKISHIESGTFDSATTLKYLYMGGNNLTGLDKVFVNGGGSIVHLGLQKNPIPCLARSDLDPLSGLKWMYMHQPTIPIFVDQNDPAPLRQKIYATPFKSGDRLDCDLRIDAPAFLPVNGPPSDEIWQTDFVRLYMENPWDLAPRNFIAEVAKCYVPDIRNLTEITKNFLCAMSDSKTATASAPRAGRILCVAILLPLLLSFQRIVF